MKVGELKKMLATLPANAEVFIKINGATISATKAKTEVKPQKDGSNFKSIIITGEQ